MRLFWMKVPEPLEEAVGACRSHLLIAGTFSALVNILYLAPTIYMMQVYDRVVPTGGLLTLYWLTVVVGIAIAVLTALDAVRQRLMLRASMRLNRLLSESVMDRSLLASGSAANSQALRDFDAVRNALSGPGIMAMFDLPWSPLFVLVAFLIHPVLGLLVLSGAAVLVLLALANQKAGRENAARAHQAQSQAYCEQEETFRKSEVVRALGMRAALVGRQNGLRETGLKFALGLQESSSRYNSVVKFVRMFMQSLALGTGAWLAVHGQISVGAIIAASVLLSRALQPVEQLVGAWPGLLQAKQSMKSLEELFAATDKASAPQVALPEPKAYLELVDVAVMSPDGSAMLLRQVSLKLEPGTFTGIVGPSGAGKSMVARVAAGAIAPDAGEARIDSASYADWQPDRLARHIGYLPQDPSLLPGTVAENISRFTLDTNAPAEAVELVEQEIFRAARLAGVHELILRLPDGYQTRIEGKGHRLSAGQSQRIALARALFGSPKVLILDEPNSALDAEGDEALGRAIAAARLGGAAVMMIAHKAAILSSADTLVIINDGAIAAQGPRQQVLDELARQAARVNVVPLHEKTGS